ncbi:MAG: hypothetical protein US31_C0013G0016 [Berkelbacteria bacterium GW2011_GWA1_36_9]|uniref:Glycosyl transferase group 1 n=1 Tax=Berkelbacteria bacterium GW2011_GWA1_36_9 TaxID=1618331 RepID=A0A0G0FFQ6_9BACT|nr:MAG: hypothetical protein US31_C0013G0016 [Berkelbacteria bacterium GW2011_GWA1_36_9]
MAEIKKIAIIAPPFTTVPPVGHGGTERIIDLKIKELTKRGYEVDVFGCGDFKISGNFRQIFPETISNMKFDPDLVEASRPIRLETAYLTAVMEILSQEDGKYDVIFNHTRGGYLFVPLFEKLKTPMITTFHLPLFKELNSALKNLKKPNFISISNAQRKNAPDLKYLATIYNGVDLNEFSFNKNPEEYLLFVGALGKHKGIHLAIEIAKNSDKILKIAGGKKREPFFSQEIQPQVDNKQIILIGEVDGKEKINLYQNAKALLFPVLIDESFGLVMIEAMACGTPVIAFDKGAVREVIEDSITGFICPSGDVSCMIKAVKKINEMPEEEYHQMRQNCRKHIEENFTVEKMVDEYLLAYNQIGNNL